MNWSRLYLLLVLLSALSANGQSLLWEVSGNGLARPSYLFGTYHILRDSYLRDDSLVQACFRRAEGVLVEVVFDSTAAGKAMQYGTMPHQNLIQLVDARDYRLIADEFNAVTGQELSFYNQVKPVVIATALSAAYARRQSDTLARFTGQPIDLYFMSQARQLRKPLAGLETLEEQLALLYDRQPVEQQARQLVQLVKRRNSDVTQALSLTDLYLKADLDGMWAFFQQASDDPDDLRTLIDERNGHWMPKLCLAMTSGTTFVAVGAGHLPGPNGLLNRLREAGYTVRPLVRTAPARR